MCTAPSCAGTTPNCASKNHVPTTGCPARRSSSCVVKMRSRASARSLVGFWLNTVSERFISRAMACMRFWLRPSPSVITASGFPSNGVVVNTSSWYRRRFTIASPCRLLRLPRHLAHFVEDSVRGFGFRRLRVNPQHPLGSGRAHQHPSGVAQIQFDAVQVFAIHNRLIQQTRELRRGKMRDDLFFLRVFRLDVHSPLEMLAELCVQ